MLRMKKIIFPLLIIPNLAVAESYSLLDKNPFMGNYQNQLAFGLGMGFDTGILVPPPVRPVPFFIGTMQYSQPTSFFRIPARRSLNFSGTVGLGSRYGWEWSDYSIPIAYITEDIALFKIKNVYGAVGAGAGLQAKENARIGTKLLFQLKLSFGYSFNEKWAGEFFIQHFSNANTDSNNYSYAFYGVGFTYNY